MFVGTCGAILSVFVGLRLIPRADIPLHMRNHKLLYDETLLSETIGQSLVSRLKAVSFLPTNTNDLKFYTTKHEHIGEAVPFQGGSSKSNKCPHPMMVPSVNRTLCVLPGRVDVARHYIAGGGLEGRKERFEIAASRLQSFGQYNFLSDGVQGHADFQKLFEDPKFLKFSQSVCPEDKQVLDPFQFNFIVQIPGQTVALHLDGVYFWGATRFEFPQWLLAVMAFSGLFKEDFVDQVQVVAYLHSWEASAERAGQFVYWVDATGTPLRETPKKFAGSAVDGTKTMHAAEVYFPSREIPVIPPQADNKLVNADGKGEKWELVSDGKRLATYDWHDLRVTAVYRARCFRSQEEVEAFRKIPDSEKMSLDFVLGKLGDDLVERKRVSREKLDGMSRFDFAQMLLKEYVKYPYSPTALVPFNYCALSRLAPWSKPVLDLVC
uniref:Uncharacterized protein n=1 Tax=Chromera velia CCMP2878 TaxID=1169474 RepID=A0A0G4FBX8_9ALVE|eukprot:Cvel_16230.t1-p1 / transcript=Cvel_16230.t1 / gene=Cvel_16230 / organism=Chromera_velia_CCMP2878 / gene_product=hypothetical protein / transcript_product=hypothetical protein / location=Cvel_scaffold1241:15429-16733(+) / protein_length=435 / sequence_SO=supercontig / SO=protein_coding / is_pseudo=false